MGGGGNHFKRVPYILQSFNKYPKNAWFCRISINVTLVIAFNEMSLLIMYAKLNRNICAVDEVRLLCLEFDIN